MGFMTFNDMLDRAAMRTPDKTFLFWADKGRALTYAEGAEAARKVAGMLAGLGIEKGDRVGLFAHNGLDYIMAMFGAWRLGAISCHINLLQAEDLTYFANDSTPKVLIYTHDMFPLIDRERREMPSIQHYICFDGEQKGAMDWGALLDRHRRRRQRLTSATVTARIFPIRPALPVSPKAPSLRTALPRAQATASPNVCGSRVPMCRSVRRPPRAPMVSSQICCRASIAARRWG